MHAVPLLESRPLIQLRLMPCFLRYLITTVRSSAPSTLGLRVEVLLQFAQNDVLGKFDESYDTKVSIPESVLSSFSGLSSNYLSEGKIKVVSNSLQGIKVCVQT